MSTTDNRRILAYLRHHQDDMVALSTRLVEMESPSDNKSAVGRLGAFLADHLRALDAQVEVVPQSQAGDHIRAVWGGGDGGALLLCHMDTVWEVGTLAQRPVRIEGGKLYGPGAFDMKGSIVNALWALRALRALDLLPGGRVPARFRQRQGGGMSHIEALKQRVVAEVGAWRATLIRTADTIHANPETAFEEVESAALLSGILEQNGFAVERGVAGLETAFVATLCGQEGGPTVAFLAEYDALPGLGHACGHNLIGTSAVGAGLAIKTILPDLAGTIQVIGTPAEEGGGGKAIMVEAGVFDGVDAAMMVHPSSDNMTRRQSLASYKVSIEFFGKTAHAAAKPDEGINALEAMILTYNGINALRQHLRDDARIHGVITHGGEAPNIVPDYTAAKFYVRAANTAYCTEVLEKVRACAQGAALATGARLAFKEYAPRYDAMMPNPKLADLAEANMALLGIQVRPPESDERMGSSDMGNVSQVVPALHPYLAIGPEELGGHTADFREAAASPAGHEGLIQAAKVMAMTAVDLLAVPVHMIEVQKAFKEQKTLVESSVTPD